MRLIAPASKTVRNKNTLIIVMCAGMCAWFAYDGFVGYAKNNDRLVEYMKNQSLPNGKINPEFAPAIDAWKGWDQTDAAGRKAMDDLVNSNKSRDKLEGWKSPTDILVQRSLVALLAVVTGVAIGWFVHCQKRRAIAEDGTVSPAAGVVVPWEKITRVDNTRWKSTGIVEITFPGADGSEQRAKFDDYELEREPLLGILDQLSEKAVNAEFIPKEDLAAEAPPAG